MIDLRSDLSASDGDLLRNLGPSRAGEGGRVVMFVAARPGEGVSSIAASFALLAAQGVRKPAWLIDLDLRRNHAFNTFAVGPFAKPFGGVGPPYSAALRTQPFFSIEPEDTGKKDDFGVFTAHRVGETRLMVTQFDAARLQPGQTIRIRAQPDYWAAVRAATDWAIVDAPAIQRASAALALVAQMDAVVLVVRADHGDAAEVDAARRAIEAHGGRIAGLVVNRLRPDARFADRLVR